jgi:hypothetical protein
MYKVYWTENVTLSAVSKDFTATEMAAALSFMEGLRKKQHADGSVGFVTFVSENPNCVGKPGVDETGPDYNWTKRRTTELRCDQPKE